MSVAFHGREARLRAELRAQSEEVHLHEDRPLCNLELGKLACRMHAVL